MTRGKLPAVVATSRNERVAAGLAAAGLYACVAVVAVRVRGRSGPLRVDATGLHYMGRPTVAERLAPYHLARLDGPELLRGVVWFGSRGGVAAAVAVLVVAALAWRDRACALIAVAGPLAALVLTEQILKPLVDRTGPNGGNFFPSGHATGVAAVAAATLFVLDRNAGRGWALLALPVLGAWVSGVSVALVQLHYHYVTDVLGGAAVGVATVLSMAAVAPPTRQHAPT